MPPPSAVEAHYVAQQRQAQAAVLLARRQWRRLSPDLSEWDRIVDPLVAVLAAAQLGAARAGEAYVPLALAEVGVDVPVAAAGRAEGFAGIAADGRPLASLLYSAVVRVKDSYAGGLQAPQALAAGEQWLGTIVRSEVADAARGAVQVAIAARPRVGYTRMVNPPCCQRCAVLAGKFFKWNTGFKRHKNCDCRHVPSTQEDFGGLVSDVHPDQIKDLTVGQRKAVGDGADLNQVINAHRKGARSSDGMTTSEGTTRRGYASYVKREAARQRGEIAKEAVSRSSGRRNVTRTGPRLTPDAIYRLAATREEALHLLAKNGYIVGDIRKVAGL